MTKTQLKTIALNVSRKLNAVTKEINNRDLVTSINYEQLKTVSSLLNDLYGVLDNHYQGKRKDGINEPMEYAELVKNRIDALIAYIRPTRLKTCHVSPKQIIQMLDMEQQGIHHLLTLLDHVEMGGK